jgi:hypothetical protein
MKTANYWLKNISVYLVLGFKGNEVEELNKSLVLVPVSMEYCLLG